MDVIVEVDDTGVEVVTEVGIGPQGPAGPPADPAELAAKVDKAGDTMTGALEITHDGTPLVVNNTQSALIGPNLAPTAPLNDTSAWTFGTGWDYVDGKMVADSTAYNGGAEGSITFTMTGLTVGATYSVRINVDRDNPDAYVYGSVSINGVGTGADYATYKWEVDGLWYATGTTFVATAETVVWSLYTYTYAVEGTAVSTIEAYLVNPSPDFGRIFTGASAEAIFDVKAAGDVLAIGHGAFPDMALASDSLAIGSQALGTADALTSSNVAIGPNAMYGRSGPSLIGNIAIGAGAMLKAGDAGGGSSCIAIGAYSLNALTTGDGNIGIGSNVGLALTTAYNNTFIGRSSGWNVTSGNYNAFIGSNAGSKLNSSSSNNVVIGGETVFSYTTQATPVNNLTAVGYQALSTGTLYDNTTGLGYQANVTGANQIQLGNSATTVYAYGAVQNRSDMRDKTAIRDTALGLDFIMALRPVDFKWDMREDYRVEPPQDDTPPERDIGRPGSRRPVDPAKAAQGAAREEGNKLKNIHKDGSKRRQRYHHGLIAQEVEAVIAATGVDFGGFQRHDLAGGDDVKSIGYTELIGPLIKAVQQQQALILSLQARLDAADL